MPGIHIGPLTIQYYGIIIMFGALMAAVMAEREARRRGLKSDVVWDMLPWLLIGGIVGARLWHILTPTQSQGITAWYYFTHPIDAINIKRGGLGIPGAVIGGAIALWIFVRAKKMSFLTWVDIIAPGLALAQAIGRWGNFVNQEVYGAPSNLPWAIFIKEANRLPEYKNVAYYHPLFLYESIYNLINMGVLLWASRRFAKQLRPGDIFLLYLIIYPVGRFLLEFLRLDPAMVGGININQTIMAGIAVVALILFLIRRRTPVPAAAEESLSSPSGAVEVAEPLSSDEPIETHPLPEGEVDAETDGNKTE